MFRSLFFLKYQSYVIVQTNDNLDRQEFVLCELQKMYHIMHTYVVLAFASFLDFLSHSKCCILVLGMQ